MGNHQHKKGLKLYKCFFLRNIELHLLLFMFIQRISSVNRDREKLVTFPGSKMCFVLRI